MFTLLPLVAMAAMARDGHSGRAVVVTTAAAAQARLAEALGDADSIDWISADLEAHTVTFQVDRAGEAYEIIAETTIDGHVASLTVDDKGRGHYALGSLSWLADAMHETAAVTRLLISAEGDVTLVASDGLRYLAIPSRGSTGNTAVEARWAAEWNNS